VLPFEFLIPRRPVSQQTRRRIRLLEWKEFVGWQARNVLAGVGPTDERNLSLTIVYLYHDAPLDSDNIIKPIQDALIGIVYSDDANISDVRSYKRPLSGIYDIARLPVAILSALNQGVESVYVRVSTATSLEDAL
jgi:crossover junction endodeoxyribonuclease RusA